GLDLSGVTLQPLASANATLSKEEKEAGVALIDIGGGTTDLAIFKDGIIRHTAVIPFGGNVITEDIKEGCSIIEKQAELLKIKFGSAWPGENNDNEIVSIPGLRGREPKEITLKNLSQIIHYRVVEIIEDVFLEIKNYGYEEQKKKLIGGIVVTGGGAQLKHIKQLIEYITGMDTRIGYPNEYLAGDNSKEIKEPLFATAVGLVLNSLEILKKEKLEASQEKPVVDVPNTEEQEIDLKEEKEVEEKEIEPEAKMDSTADYRRNIFDKWFEKFKEFLDNAE
ncbi:MAG TPA: cell division protein FtsA, partial [Flavobacteriaceae bacterium]|nr:cell division protein FtsA [Flavobacteriaceae bacterium]